MADIDLTTGLDSTDLRASVARALGYGDQSSVWTAQQIRDIERCLRGGVRRFYNPPPIPGDRKSHKWSFLNPTATISVSAGTDSYALPADFASFVGDVIYRWNSVNTIVDIIGIQELLGLRNSPMPTGWPQYAAINQVAPVSGNQSTWTIELWPEPEADYTIQYRYAINSSALTDAQPHAYGGPQHAQTLEAACLAEAEIVFMPGETEYRNLFMERLIASVSSDRANFPSMAGMTHGYGVGCGRIHYGNSTLVSYNGIAPS